ncbi:MAG TPA: hypothetical protein VMN76_06865 [Acidobacteriota bacterium]|nr:hypothetical protein [Acidobacteriota bacterium]
MAKNITVELLKIFLLVLLLHLAMFYFRLGWFIVVIWLGGFLMALFITKGYRAAERKTFATPVVFLMYVFSIFVVWNVFIDQKSSRTFLMTWVDKGSTNQYRQPEIVLRFVDYPNHSIGIFSSDLKGYLRSYSKSELPVGFEIRSDFWCMRGYNAKRIGDLENWTSAWGYSGSEGADASPNPWPERWWCP